MNLLAACLMPDHLHVVAAAGPLDTLTWLARYKSYTTQLAWKAGHRGALWQPGRWDRLLRNGNEVAATVRYVLRNPVAAGLVDDATDWPWAWACWPED